MNNIQLKLAALLVALLVLPSCGGGGGDGGGGQGGGTIITPPSRFYGAYETGSRGPNCSDGWSVGVATGYSSKSAAASAATSECRRGGGRSNCDERVGEFGSAYSNSCMAVWSGRRSDGGCNLGFEHGKTLTAARTAALSACQGRYSTCEIGVSECSTSGPADSFYRIVRPGNTGGGGGGDNGGGGGNNGGDNRPPVVRGGFRDATVQQGRGWIYRNISGQFSDPDGDRLTITAISNAPNFATARVSGDNLTITGVQAFNTGAVTITVTATDPGGLSVSTRFSVRVSAAPGSGGGGGGGNNGGDNRPPVVRGGFRDATIQQGGRRTYDNISQQFSDPDRDELRITARSNTPYVTASVTGSSLVIRGVQAIAGAATITVTATDPGGLSASTTFSVRVTAAPRQWGYYAIYPSNCSGGRFGWQANDGYSDERSALNARNSVCTSRGECPTGNAFRNQCVGIAVWDGCGYAVTFNTSAASAQNAALAKCRNDQGTNCRSGARCAGEP